MTWVSNHPCSPCSSCGGEEHCGVAVTDTFQLICPAITPGAGNCLDAPGAPVYTRTCSDVFTGTFTMYSVADGLEHPRATPGTTSYDHHEYLHIPDRDEVGAPISSPEFYYPGSSNVSPFQCAWANNTQEYTCNQPSSWQRFPIWTIGIETGDTAPYTWWAIGWGGGYTSTSIGGMKSDQAAYYNKNGGSITGTYTYVYGGNGKCDWFSVASLTVT